MAVVDVGRQKRNADLDDFLAKEVELVLIAPVHGHGGGVELNRRGSP